MSITNHPDVVTYSTEYIKPEPLYKIAVTEFHDGNTLRVLPSMSNGGVDGIKGIEFRDSDGLLIKTNRERYWSRDKNVTPEDIYPYIKAAQKKADNIFNSRRGSWLTPQIKLDWDYFFIMLVSEAWTQADLTPVENLDDIRNE